MGKGITNGGSKETIRSEKLNIALKTNQLSHTDTFLFLIRKKNGLIFTSLN